jgi:hypothetical protein
MVGVREKKDKQRWPIEREKNQDMGGKRIVALESLILTFYESHGDIFNDYLDLFNLLVK